VVGGEDTSCDLVPKLCLGKDFREALLHSKGEAELREQDVPKQSLGTRSKQSLGTRSNSRLLERAGRKTRSIPDNFLGLVARIGMSGFYETFF
jgi:hypothetical protein